MRFLIIFISVCCFVSCKFSEEKKEAVVTNEVKQEFEVYVPSEMSLHMNDMFEFNEKIKAKIKEGKTLENFPEDFLKIYTAKLTDTKSRNETFEVYSKMFIEKEKAIFDTTDKTPIIEKYNNAINLCITCHKTECVGPIPRIKKLLIQ